MEDNRHNTPQAQPYLPPESSDREMVELVRMARERQRVPAPDPKREWQRVENRIDNGSEDPMTLVQTAHTKPLQWLKLIVAAAVGAAAMLAVMLYYNHMQVDRDIEGLVALYYDDSPQQVTFVNNDNVKQNLFGKDSLSFRYCKQPPHSAESRRQELSTPRGMDFKVILSDGTEVWLNAESTIKFPSLFTSGERRVELKGEAYFKVAHNNNRPFTVSTEKMDIRVLGTEFNLRSYEAESPRVALVKGSIAILNHDSNTEECRLQPGQDAWRDDEGRLHVDTADIYGVTQWVDGFFYFDNVPLIDILRELGRWYNLGVVFRRPSEANILLHFSASRKGDIKEALSIINSLLKVQITVEGNNIVVR